MHRIRNYLYLGDEVVMVHEIAKDRVSPSYCLDHPEIIVQTGFNRAVELQSHTIFTHHTLPPDLLQDSRVRF